MSPSLDIALIGGSGFIGTELTKRLLAAGHRVRNADIAPSRAFPDLRRDCDVRDLAAMTAFLKGADVAINLAAQHSDDVRPRSLYDEVNVGGARTLCAAAEAHGITRLIFTSSVAVYGFSDTELSEDGPKRPFNDYGRTKLEAEVVMQDWFRRAPGRTLVMVRPTVVFGRGNRGNVYNLMKHLAGNPYVMVGQGRNRKSMAYVENVAAFLEFTLSLPPGEHIFNYVDKPDFDMETLVALVRKWLGKESAPMIRLPYGVAYAIGKGFDALALATGRKLPISAIRVRKFCGSSAFDASRALASGFTPAVEVRDALARTFEHEFQAKGGGAPAPAAVSSR